MTPNILQTDHELRVKKAMVTAVFPGDAKSNDMPQIETRWLLKLLGLIALLHLEILIIIHPVFALIESKTSEILLFKNCNWNNNALFC